MNLRQPSVRCSAAILAASGTALFLFSPLAFAYLDPGSGSMLVTAVVIAFATLLYFSKGLYYKAVRWLRASGNREFQARRKHGIVFYSEGGQYWHTFRPVIEALARENVPLTYLSSDAVDPGLNFQADSVEVRHLAPGSSTFAVLNTLEADVCVTTTPGLDVFQMRRSPGVAHYAHLIHAPTTGTYKLFSFDYFDSVLCSGQHQIDGLRELERRRGTPQKRLLETGCVYMDVIEDRFCEQAPTRANSDKLTVLIAPSWGTNALFHQYGARVIKPLVAAGMRVIVRPHPQSRAVEQPLLAAVREQAGESDLLSWDEGADGFAAMLRSDVMISDLSGIVFDYAFIFRKPVVTVELDIDLRGLDANHMSGGLWEAGQLDRVGRCIAKGDLDRLADIVRDVATERDRGDLAELRDQSLFNFGKAGQVAANQIREIAAQVTTTRGESEA